MTCVAKPQKGWPSVWMVAYSSSTVGRSFSLVSYSVLDSFSRAVSRRLVEDQLLLLLEQVASWLLSAPVEGTVACSACATLQTSSRLNLHVGFLSASQHDDQTCIGPSSLLHSPPSREAGEVVAGQTQGGHIEPPHSQLIEGGCPVRCHRTRRLR